jgi:hypothetical protein
MLTIRKLEVDFINKVTIATVEVYEITMGIQRLRDTFYITLTGIYDINDVSLQDAIYAKLGEIGYNLLNTVDPTVVNLSETPATNA